MQSLILKFPPCALVLVFERQVLDIVRAAESLAMGNPMTLAEAPPKSPVDFHEEKMTKTTTVVMSKHTLDTQPQVFTESCVRMCVFH